jgi:hypothetical protein
LIYFPTEKQNQIEIPKSEIGYNLIELFESLSSFLFNPILYNNRYLFWGKKTKLNDKNKI